VETQEVTMRIENSGMEIRRAELTKAVQSQAESGKRQEQATQAGAQAPRSDRVQISDAGRALAAQAASDVPQSEGLSPERVDQIRQRILSGAYDSVVVVDAVARRMLESGDI
jgi:anti-sigma28 factor (negative regulator of flagellin synthesis)